MGRFLNTAYRLVALNLAVVWMTSSLQAEEHAREVDRHLARDLRSQDSFFKTIPGRKVLQLAIAGLLYAMNIQLLIYTCD